MDALPEYLMRELEKSGLINAVWLKENQLLIRTEACLPRIRILGNEEFVRQVDVMLTFDEDRISFRIEHPDAGEVMHPNWDGNGYWRVSRAENYVYSDNASLVELIRYMIGGLKMKTSCFTLEEPVNRNAVSWCYRNGKVPIKVISTVQGGRTVQTKPAAERPRFPVTVSRISIRPERFEE